MGKFLTAGDILAIDDRKTQVVDVPEWGEGAQVRIRELSARDRDWYRLQAFDVELVDGKPQLIRKGHAEDIKARLLVKSLVNIDNSPMFDEDEIPMLGAKSAAAIDRIFAAAQKLSGLDATAVEAAEKNSASGPTSASPTG